MKARFFKVSESRLSTLEKDFLSAAYRPVNGFDNRVLDFPFDQRFVLRYEEKQERNQDDGTGDFNIHIGQVGLSFPRPLSHRGGGGASFQVAF